MNAFLEDEMITENHRCAICAAEFGSSKDLVCHERDEHSQHGARASEAPARQGQDIPDRGRQNREFSRRNSE